MVTEAQFVLDELEMEQAKILRIKRAESKKMTCLFCDYRGRSVIEERQPWITFIIALLLFLTLGFWFLFLMPCLFGSLRQQTHRC